MAWTLEHVVEVLGQPGSQGTLGRPTGKWTVYAPVELVRRLDIEGIDRWPPRALSGAGKYVTDMVIGGRVAPLVLPLRAHLAERDRLTVGTSIGSVSFVVAPADFSRAEGEVYRALRSGRGDRPLSIDDATVVARAVLI
jgi:hypothetical protein